MVGDEIFDGHNGSAAATYTKENLLKNVRAAVPLDLNRDELVAALPRALVAGFVKTDKDFQEREQAKQNPPTAITTRIPVFPRTTVENMKVLVTGASGYLGGKLCQALLTKGHSVRALVRRTSDLSTLPSPTGSRAFELAYGDVTDYRSLLDAFSGCHVIFHAAALVDTWLPDPAKFFSVNVGGLKNVLQAARETKTVEKIIHTSSIAALGSTDGYIADEKQVHHEKYFCTEYERSKATANKIALQAAAEGVPIVVLYPGVIYGPGKINGANGVVQLLIERFNGSLPGYLGYGKDKFPFSHIDDVVEGHIAAMDKGGLGERYLLTGENASYMQVFDIAAIITGTKRPRFSIPLWVIETFGCLSVLFYHLTGKLPHVNPGSVRMLRHQWAYSCEKAKAELDYNPRSLKEGLEELLPWLKSLGLINY